MPSGFGTRMLDSKELVMYQSLLPLLTAIAVSTMLTFLSGCGQRGVVVTAEGDTLTVTDPTGEAVTTYEVAPDAAVMLDGKNADLSEIDAGDSVFVISRQEGDKHVATRVEAYSSSESVAPPPGDSPPPADTAPPVETPSPEPEPIPPDDVTPSEADEPAPPADKSPPEEKDPPSPAEEVPPADDPPAPEAPSPDLKPTVSLGVAGSWVLMSVAAQSPGGPNSSSQTYMGQIAAVVDKEVSLMIQGEPQAFDVNEATTIMVDGRLSTLAEVQPGFMATIIGQKDGERIVAKVIFARAKA
jgi:hypothetical protein